MAWYRSLIPKCSSWLVLATIVVLACKPITSSTKSSDGIAGKVNCDGRVQEDTCDDGKTTYWYMGQGQCCGTGVNAPQGLVQSGVAGGLSACKPIACPSGASGAGNGAGAPNGGNASAQGSVSCDGRVKEDTCDDGKTTYWYMGQGQCCGTGVNAPQGLVQSGVAGGLSACKPIACGDDGTQTDGD
jgi:hypothetical protein